MDISKCHIEYKDGISNDVKLSTSQGVKLRYPNYASMKRMENIDPLEAKTQIIVNAIDYIYDDKGMYSWKDYSKDELKDFVEGLTEENYNKLQDFVGNFPTMVVDLQGKCTKCGFEHNVRYTDFYDFFT
jgi:hypothetical protein